MLTRRFAVKATAAAAALVAVRANEARAVLGSDAVLPNVAAGLLRDRAAAHAVGKAYLESAPTLTRARLLTDLGSVQIAPPVGVGTIADQFDRAVRTDFANGHTVVVHGWILSRTEASLCALAYLRGV